MAEDSSINNNPSFRPNNQFGGKKIIDESNYKINMPKEKNPSAIGEGGDPLFMNIRASKKQLTELLDETTTVQDWVQRETSNNAALSILRNENLEDIYYNIKDGFGDYGPIMVMGFKNPQGVEIIRLKSYDKDGNVLQVLSGQLALDELNKRALAYQQSSGYEEIVEANEETGVIEDYTGNIEDYT